MNKLFTLIASAATLLLMTSCLKDGTETIVLDPHTGVPGIPSDSSAEPNPIVTENNAVIPNVQYSTETEGDNVIVRIDMTGVQDPETLEWLRLIGTGGEKGSEQNVWVEIDGKPKGIDVYNTIDDEDNAVLVMNDFVFLVDNSGSMGDEADAVARDIVSWAKSLNATLDVRFGLVGYDGCIHGAINLTTYSELNAYLNEREATGVSRTMGFGGADSYSLESAAGNYYIDCQNECGVAALRFADSQFSFREGANRIYVNFTDEPNYPGGMSKYSVEYVETAWESYKGTIHTVISDEDILPISEESLEREDPTRMSKATGGSIIITDSSFAGVTLYDLPVSMAMQNSYVIRFTNVREFMDGKLHEVKITIVTADNSVMAEKVFMMAFSE